MRDAKPSTSEVNLFSSNGRIGRLRYIVYSFFIPLCATLLYSAGLFAYLYYSDAPVQEGWSTSSIILLVASGLLVLFLFLFSITLTMKRCHDFNQSGWLSLLLLIPFGVLLFWFTPGSKDSNRFAAPPPANSIAVFILAMLLIVLVVAGVVMVPRDMPLQQWKYNALHQYQKIKPAAANNNTVYDPNKLTGYSQITPRSPNNENNNDN